MIRLITAFLIFPCLAFQLKGQNNTVHLDSIANEYVAYDVLCNISQYDVNSFLVQKEVLEGDYLKIKFNESTEMYEGCYLYKQDSTSKANTRYSYILDFFLTKRKLFVLSRYFQTKFKGAIFYGLSGFPYRIYENVDSIDILYSISYESINPAVPSQDINIVKLGGKSLKKYRRLRKKMERKTIFALDSCLSFYAKITSQEMKKGNYLCSNFLLAPRNSECNDTELFEPDYVGRFTIEFGKANKNLNSYEDLGYIGGGFHINFHTIEERITRHSID